MSYILSVPPTNALTAQPIQNRIGCLRAMSLYPRANSLSPRLWKRETLAQRSNAVLVTSGLLLNCLNKQWYVAASVIVLDIVLNHSCTLFKRQKASLFPRRSTTNHTPGQLCCEPCLIELCETLIIFQLCTSLTWTALHQSQSSRSKTAPVSTGQAVTTSSGSTMAL